jgi:sugar O-acyltransferase (sialic acid O-acetyltransferase NeuD family)
MEELVIVGGGGHSKVVISIVQKLAGYRILGYTDLKDNGAVIGIPFLGGDSELGLLATGGKELSAVIAVGQVGLGELRCELFERLSTLDLRFPAIVSPDAIVSKEASCGHGAVVMDGAVINAGASVGTGSIVNTNSTIEHDSVISDWVHVAPGATICGGVTIGRFSMVGAGATVIEGIEVASGCIIGAGATVVSSLTDPGVYVGCPARRVRLSA